MWSGPPVGDFNTQSLTEIWQGEPMQNLRSQFDQGRRPQGCELCWRAERAGYSSKRITDLKRFSHHTPGATLASPVYLDLKLGSLCNIKCRICSSQYSQKWREDEIALYGSQRWPTRLNWIDEAASLWQDLEQIAHTIEFIDFTGGEPFLVKGHWRLLERLVELGAAHRIKIHYNTNGTVLPSPAQRRLWREFKWVETMFSLDGTGAQFEYQRHPAQWATALNTWETIHSEQHTHSTLCYTVSVFNVMYMQEFQAWADQYGVKPYWNLLHGPDHYSIKNLPMHIKQQIAHTVPDTSVREYMMNSAQDPEAWQEFLDQTQRLDTLRRESFAHTFPELHRLIQGS